MQKDKELVLNDEQRKIVEEKYGLVPYMVSKMNLPTNNTEDLHGVACIGLCKAVASFDASKGVSLDNYICRVIRNELLSALNLSRNKHATYEYLEEIVEYPSSDTNNPRNIVESKLIYEAILDSLSERHRKIVDLIMGDVEFREIADICNCSISTVNHVWSNFRRKLKQELLGKD